MPRVPTLNSEKQLSELRQVVDAIATDRIPCGRRLVIAGRHTVSGVRLSASFAAALRAAHFICISFPTMKITG